MKLWVKYDGQRASTQEKSIYIIKRHQLLCIYNSIWLSIGEFNDTCVPNENLMDNHLGSHRKRMPNA